MYFKKIIPFQFLTMMHFLPSPALVFNSSLPCPLPHPHGSISLQWRAQKWAIYRGIITFTMVLSISSSPSSKFFNNDASSGVSPPMVTILRPWLTSSPMLEVNPLRPPHGDKRVQIRNSTWSHLCASWLFLCTPTPIRARSEQNPYPCASTHKIPPQPWPPPRPPWRVPWPHEKPIGCCLKTPRIWICNTVCAPHPYCPPRAATSPTSQLEAQALKIEDRYSELNDVAWMRWLVVGSKVAVVEPPSSWAVLFAKCFSLPQSSITLF